MHIEHAANISGRFHRQRLFCRRGHVAGEAHHAVVGFHGDIQGGEVVAGEKAGLHLAGDPGVAQQAAGLGSLLTVAPGAPASHRGKGWETVTDAAIHALAARGGPLVAILWGRDAQSLKPALGTVPVIASAHPSPLSADRGFFGSRPFSRANALLEQQGGAPIDWHLD